MDLLKDSDGGVRDAVAIALGEIGLQRPNDVVPALMKLLDDKLWYVRDSAAESLGKVDRRPRRPYRSLRSCSVTATGESARRQP